MNKIYLVCILALLTQSAQAVDTTLKSQVKINGTCQLSVSPLNIGILTHEYKNATTTMIVLCSNNMPYTIAMNYPQNGQGNFGGIYTSGMLKPSKPGNPDWVDYSLYLPDNTPWGSQEGTFNGDYGTTPGKPIGVLKDKGTGVEQTFPIKIFASPKTSARPSGYIMADTYSDTVTAVLTF